MSPPPRRPLALRTRLLLAIVAGVGVAMLVLVAVFNVALARSLDNDADEILRGRASAERAALVIEDGAIVPPEGASAPSLDTRAWVFAGSRAVRVPPADAELQTAARELAATGGGFRDLGSRARLHALPVAQDGVRIGTVVAVIALGPYNRTRLAALVGSIALGVLVLGGVALASALILRAALRPVARMTADAAAWSERDLDTRFAMGPPHDEITRLAATLDGLLDRLAAGMRRERRMTAEVSHELRTPLAQIRAEADLALRRERTPREYREALEVILSGADRLESTVETLMATARQETRQPRGTGDARRAAAGVLAAFGPAAAHTGVELALTSPDPVHAGVETPVVERILQPIVENACRYAHRRVEVSVEARGREVVIEVRDDGPGVPAPERDAIFEPGVRGAANGSELGAGLGLSLSRRLARAAGGEVEAVDTEGGGAFRVRVPGA